MIKSYYANEYKIKTLKLDPLSLAEPIFAIGKKRSKKVSTIKISDNTTLDVIPSVEYGGLLLSDRELLIYMYSKIHTIVCTDNQIPQRLTFTLKDYFQELGFSDEEIRLKGGSVRADIRNSIERLSATKLRIITVKNKKSNIVERQLLSFVDEVLSEERHWREIRLTIDIPEWIRDKFINNKFGVLTLHPNYFDMKDSCLIRMYDISRKFCGKQEFTEMSYDKFIKRIGLSNVNESRTKNRVIKQSEILLNYGYKLVIDFDTNKVKFINIEVESKNEAIRLAEKALKEENERNEKEAQENKEKLEEWREKVRLGKESRLYDSKGREKISVAKLIGLTPVGMTFSEFLHENTDKYSVQGKNIFNDEILFIEQGYASIYSTKQEVPPAYNEILNRTGNKKDDKKTKNDEVTFSNSHKVISSINVTVVDEQVFFNVLSDEISFVKDEFYPDPLDKMTLIESMSKSLREQSDNPYSTIKIVGKNKQENYLNDDKYSDFIYKIYLEKSV